MTGAVAYHRVVLVGFMACGKSTVGRLLAKRLGWRFVDVDERIENEEGCSVSEIFRLRGEAHFRQVEERITSAFLGERRVVLASGGGWACSPGRLERLPERTASVWLRVSAEEAVRRSALQDGLRPLLAGRHPLERARDLLAQREAHYAAADVKVDTEHRTPEDVTAEIVAFMTGQPAKPSAVEP